jgi:hypothetical protein
LTPRDDDPAGQIGQYLIELGEKTADTAVMIEALQPFARGWEMLMEGSVHAAVACAGRPCPFHAPSDHPLKDAPINVRFDKHALVERFCEHGVGHDDPDSVAWLHSIGETWAGVHGCDGCCVSADR